MGAYMLEFKSNYLISGIPVGRLTGSGKNPQDFSGYKPVIDACVMHKRGRYEKLNLLFFADIVEFERMLISARQQLSSYDASPIQKHFQVIVRSADRIPGTIEPHCFFIYLLICSEGSIKIKAFVLESAYRFDLNVPHLRLLEKHQIPYYYSASRMQVTSNGCFYFSLNWACSAVQIPDFFGRLDHAYGTPINKQYLKCIYEDSPVLRSDISLWFSTQVCSLADTYCYFLDPLCLPSQLLKLSHRLSMIKKRAKSEGLPYQTYIKSTMHKAIIH